MERRRDQPSIDRRLVGVNDDCFTPFLLLMTFRAIVERLLGIRHGPDVLDVIEQSLFSPGPNPNMTANLEESSTHTYPIPQTALILLPRNSKNKIVCVLDDESKTESKGRGIKPLHWHKSDA